MLTIYDHRRDSAELKYIYPVISRRSGGLSIGINLNTNNACNWRCIYCQVPGLNRGKAPTVELDRLEKELCNFLYSVLHGDFYSHQRIPPDQCRICDIAISGNGEPTSAREFDQVVKIIGDIIKEYGLLDNLKLVLITNGSLTHKRIVQKGISHLSELNGEVWYKLDSATVAGIRKINSVSLPIEKTRKNLERVTNLCHTWIQTCVFGIDGNPPDESEQKAYIDFLSSILMQDVKINGVFLYGIARPSMQSEAERLTRLPGAWLEQYAAQIRKTGIEVKISV